jgi:hypothetical protein
MRDTNNINFGNRWGGNSFGSPPPPGGGGSQGGSFGDININAWCYTMTRSWELVLTHIPDPALMCNWNIQWSNQHKIIQTTLYPPPGSDPDWWGPQDFDCNNVNCPQSFTPGSPTITIEGAGGRGLFNPAPNGGQDPVTACNLRGGPNQDPGGGGGYLGPFGETSRHAVVKMKKVDTITGCEEYIRSFIPWGGSDDVFNGGSNATNAIALVSIANDLFCEPQNDLASDWLGGLGGYDIPGYEGDEFKEEAEDIFRKILDCFCQIERETDPAEKERMINNMVRKMNECAGKWNKAASTADQKAALGYDPNALVPIISNDPRGTNQAEAVEDLTSIEYQRCLGEIVDFCAD